MMDSPEGASLLPENWGTHLPAGLPFSPGLGLCPISSLCTNIGRLSCMESVTPRRRLRLSPDALTPSPGCSQLPVPEGTATPTGAALEPPAGPQACSSSEASCSQTPLHCSLSRSESTQAVSKGRRGACGSKQLQGADRRAEEGSASPQGMGKKVLRTTIRFHSPTGSTPGRKQSQAGEMRKGSSGVSPAAAPAMDSEILTGDFSRPCSLPLEEGQHRDLRYISPDTVASLLRGRFAGVVEEYVVVDCRYPYEYAGGHIKGALNVYQEEQLAQWLLPDPLGMTPRPHSSILIFHCEFSSERGPRLCRSLRRMDRDANQYPALWYPELYVLSGGYREFYRHFQDLCEPQGYVQMRHKDFRAELRSYQRRKQPWSLCRIRKQLFKPRLQNQTLSPGTPLPLQTSAHPDSQQGTH